MIEMIGGRAGNRAQDTQIHTWRILPLSATSGNILRVNLLRKWVTLIQMVHKLQYCQLLLPKVLRNTFNIIGTQFFYSGEKCRADLHMGKAYSRTDVRVPVFPPEFGVPLWAGSKKTRNPVV